MQKGFCVRHINCFIKTNKLPFYLSFFRDEILMHSKYIFIDYTLAPALDRSKESQFWIVLIAQFLAFTN